MSQLRFSSGIVSNLMVWKEYATLADYRIISLLVKELTWNEEFSKRNLEADIANFCEEIGGFSFPVTAGNFRNFTIGLIGSVQQVHNYLPGDGSNPVAYRKRNHGCFSTREIVALSRVWAEYTGDGVNLFQGLRRSGLYLSRDVAKRSKVEFWWPSSHCTGSSAYAYEYSGDEIWSTKDRSALKQRLMA
jgi:hypothetical protein